MEIPGWTSVGDRRGGAYVGAFVPRRLNFAYNKKLMVCQVYDCAIKTKEGTVIHALKRYSAFAQLYTRLRATLPVSTS